MNINPLIPYPETLPVPAWILIVLEQFFFFIHILLINSILGISIVLFYKWIKAEKENDFIDLNKPLAQKIPILFAIAINMAIPALLFIQVVFGNLFYTSSILIGTFWISIIPLLILAYYAAYFHYRKFETSKFAKIALLLVVLTIFYISFIFVNNISLMELPQKWNRYFTNRSGTIIILDELTIFARYFHFLVASFAIGGLFYAIYYKFRRNLDDAVKTSKIKEGLKIFSYSTLLQIMIGIVFLLSLQKSIMLKFMGDDPIATTVFVSGIIFAIISFIYGLRENVTATAVFTLATITSMVINRYNLRIFQLGDNFNLSCLMITPQWDVFIIFVIVLIIGLTVIACLLKTAFSKSMTK